MFRFAVLLICVSTVMKCFSQENSLRKSKRFAASRDTILVNKYSINPYFFEIKRKNKIVIDSSFYKIDFKKSTLIFNQKMLFDQDSIEVTFQDYPDFLTQPYFIFDEKKVVPNGADANYLYKIEKPIASKSIPFDGLTSSGSITRGITVGNNQNAVVNSALDLQVSGKISDKVSLRASIQDSNIPLQQGGYSQRLDEFDQIFIELYSKKWNIRAGDLFLENRKSQFLNFNKKVQGLLGNFTFGSEKNQTNVFATAAIVRGQYAKSSFVGQEGNQGPFKLRGQNGELFVLVVSGSERVFVNGILLKRGENNDYMIDYNAGEIRFTSLFPINSEMRITIEYQFSDRAYNRFLAYTGATHTAEKWELGGVIYSENDSKNQPLQQSLTTEQVQNLANAGDDILQMTSQSAFEDSFAANKILYRKITQNNITFFEYSTNSTEVLFNVRFSNVGNNLGNYKVLNTNSIGRIYQYIAPINGVLQGSFEPIVRLVAPTSSQVATVLGKFSPSEKTNFDFEVGVSNNDKNLFSAKNDNDNIGLAAKLAIKQDFEFKKIKFNISTRYQFVQQQFATIERLFNIEFNRDWNLQNGFGNQSFLTTNLSASIKDFGTINYQLENLQFSENFKGNKHSLLANIRSKKITFNSNSSLLDADGILSKSRFLRTQNQSKFHFYKNWVGATLQSEDNLETIKTTNKLSSLSQKFVEYGAFVGRGDSTKVFVELGFLRRLNDSLQNTVVQRVNQSNAFYVKSKLIQTTKSNLSVFINYRNLKFTDQLRAGQPSLNSRLLYNSQFFSQILQTNTVFETNSGTIAQQDFTYVEVDAGRGIYVWKDYNNNGIQELDEFEVAQFADQAKFVRVFLPNQIFVATHQNKFSQSLIFNFNQWQNQKGLRKKLSYFYNQTTFLSDRKIFRTINVFDLNPFNSSQNILGLNSNFRNTLFFNRGKQRHSVTYNFLANETKNLFSAGSQQNSLKSNQLLYQHLVQKTWLLTADAKQTNNQFLSENFVIRNFDLSSRTIQPKISYILNSMASLDLFLEFQSKKNKIGALETLDQQKVGLSFTYSSKKQFTVNGEIVYIKNNFSGNSQSAVAFQMLEGLQSGANSTWRLLLQKRLSSFLDININYQGRKSENNVAIQTGNVQLRAFF
jgi:hypothetical protein